MIKCLVPGTLPHEQTFKLPPETALFRNELYYLSIFAFRQQDYRTQAPVPIFKKFLVFLITSLK